MKIYCAKNNSDKIELVGIGAGGDLIFRYLGEEFKEVFFSIDRHLVLKDYIRCWE